MTPEEVIRAYQERQAEYVIWNGKIAALQARPTAASMEKVRAIQQAVADEESSQ